MALMGLGIAKGENRAIEAANAAISSPLLEDVSIEGATGIIINITGGNNLTLHEVNEASTLIQEAAHEDAEIIFGAVIDENMPDEIKITVIATGFGGEEEVARTIPQTKPVVETTKTTAPEEFEQETLPTEEQLKVPPLLRKSKDPNLSKARRVARDVSINQLEEDEYDIPTFIRRQQE